MELAGLWWGIGDCVWQSTRWYNNWQRRQTCETLLCGCQARIGCECDTHVWLANDKWWCDVEAHECETHHTWHNMERLCTRVQGMSVHAACEVMCRCPLYVMMGTPPSGSHMWCESVCLLAATSQHIFGCVFRYCLWKWPTFNAVLKTYDQIWVVRYQQFNLSNQTYSASAPFF